jgi:SnoaL-like domain
VNESPIERLLAAIDSLDVEAVMALLAPEARLLATDGRRAEGTDQMRELVTESFAELRSTTHEITAQWHVDDARIAEIDARYELRDFLRVGALPRAVVLRDGPAGIADLRFYGAHEHPVSEHDTGEEWGTLVRGRWIPPL